tara:strand:+ start:414 stop:1211 length:798 start_codon:yes stop_codon:yes gene_type:complete
MKQLFTRWFDFIDLIRMDRWFNKLEMTFFCGAVLLLLHPVENPFELLAYFTAFNLAFYPYLYLINSVCEREEDLKGGKDIYYGFSHGAAIAITVVFGILTLVLSFYPGREETAVIGVLAFIAATVYSLEPFHLKRRGILGVINGPFYQRVLPFLFFVTLLDSYPMDLVVYLTIWLFLGSFEVFLLHELKDYQADLTAEVETYVVRVGETRAHQFRNLVHITIIAYAFGSWALFETHVSLFLCVAMLMFKFKNGHINYKLQPIASS